MKVCENQECYTFSKHVIIQKDLIQYFIFAEVWLNRLDEALFIKKYISYHNNVKI